MNADPWENNGGLDTLEDRLGHRFKDRDIFVEALTPQLLRERAQGESIRPNERLEFLGDAVLDLLVSDMLIAERRTPAKRLSKTGPSLFPKQACRRLEAPPGLGPLLRLGKGEELSGGRRRNPSWRTPSKPFWAPSTWMAASEAARRLVEAHFCPVLAEPGLLGRRDFKTFLKSCARGRGLGLPGLPCRRGGGPTTRRLSASISSSTASKEGPGTGRNKKRGRAGRGPDRAGSSRFRTRKPREPADHVQGIRRRHRSRKQIRPPDLGPRPHDPPRGRSQRSAVSADFSLSRRRTRSPFSSREPTASEQKLKIAFAAGRHDTVGIDLVAMCVNDILTLGAEPLFFLDYFATGRLDRRTEGGDVIKESPPAAGEAGCALLGGETAEMPSFYRRKYDLAGFAVGVVERKKIIDGRKIRPGHVLVGLPSSGLHSNGYSLARKVLFDRRRFRLRRARPWPFKPLGDVLLAPTRIYVPVSFPRPARCHPWDRLHHRRRDHREPPADPPSRMRRRHRRSAWTPQPIFRLIEESGVVSRTGCFRVFNMGIGAILAVPPLRPPRPGRTETDAGTAPRHRRDRAGRRGVRYAG